MFIFCLAASWIIVMGQIKCAHYSSGNKYGKVSFYELKDQKVLVYFLKTNKFTFIIAFPMKFIFYYSNYKILFIYL